MRYADATSAVVDEIVGQLEEELPGLPTLETAADVLVDALATRFAEGSVLIRTFATVAYERLPEPNRDFARRLAGRASLPARTPVLSLLATRGVEEAWNDRRTSRGHVGIPLLSGQQVAAIPMVAALMKALGVEIAAVSGADTAIVAQTIGTAAGLFLVDDARSATDGYGRLVIPAQDFVAGHSVQSVFGFGGVYAGTTTFVATVAFTREAVPRREAERFMRLTNIFKATTMRHAFRGTVFADGPSRT